MLGGGDGRLGQAGGQDHGHPGTPQPVRAGQQGAARAGAAQNRHGMLHGLDLPGQGDQPIKGALPVTLPLHHRESLITIQGKSNDNKEKINRVEAPFIYS